MAVATAKPGKTRVLGGITVIDTPLITRALDYARIHSEPFLFNHAVRSWLFAVCLRQLQDVPHDAEVVAVGSLGERFVPGRQRPSTVDFLTNAQFEE
jgi:hypothetical protein